MGSGIDNEKEGGKMTKTLRLSLHNALINHGRSTISLQNEAC